MMNTILNSHVLLLENAFFTAYLRRPARRLFRSRLNENLPNVCQPCHILRKHLNRVQF
jgi:hypothetical protein